jgi:hypothetical protein
MEELRDQTPMATPPKRLRAHEARKRLRESRGERGLPPLGTHAGGIATERGDAQTAEPLLSRLTGETAAKFDRVPIRDPSVLERRLERKLVELGVVPRAGEAPYIDECADARFAENRHELCRRPRPMADRPDDHRVMISGSQPNLVGSD